MKKNYFKNSWKLFVKSFKEFDKKVIFIMLYDLIFLFILAISFIIYSRSIQNKLNILNTFSPDIIQQSQNELAQTSSGFSNLIASVIIGFLLILLITFIAACIFKGLIWFKIAKKKFTTKIFKKFILLNLLWFLIWIIPSVILFFTLKQDLLAPTLLIITVLLIHFTNLLYISFTETQKLNSIKKAFQIGIKKIHLFILPYILMSIVFLIISQLYWLYNFMPGNTSLILTVLILIVYLAWFRIYLYNVVKDI